VGKGKPKDLKEILSVKKSIIKFLIIRSLITIITAKLITLIRSLILKIVKQVQKSKLFIFRLLIRLRLI